MSDKVAHACPAELGGILCRFLGVERVADSPLLRKVYHGGLAILALWAVAAMVQSVGMALDHPGGGAVGFFVVSATVGFGTVAWRLVCELALGVLLMLAG